MIGGEPSHLNKNVVNMLNHPRRMDNTYNDIFVWLITNQLASNIFTSTLFWWCSQPHQGFLKIGDPSLGCWASPIINSDGCLNIFSFDTYPKDFSNKLLYTFVFDIYASEITAACRQRRLHLGISKNHSQSFVCSWWWWGPNKTNMLRCPDEVSGDVHLSSPFLTIKT